METAAKHMTSVRRFAPQAKIVFDTVDLHFLREERQALVSQDNLASLPSLFESSKSFDWRGGPILRSSSALSRKRFSRPNVQESMFESCRRSIRSKKVPFPISMDALTSSSSAAFSTPQTLTPSSILPTQIFPRVLDRLPDVVLQVIGPDASPEIERLACPNIQVLGYVPDVRPIFDRARVSVAPLRFGAGVKGKVNQSMALGVPTVLTSIAAEGMYLVHEENAMIADDPDRFADEVVRLWTSRELWERVSAQGRRQYQGAFLGRGRGETH